VKGYLGYEVVNKECTPEDKFLGVHELLPAVTLNFEMTKVDEKTWKGYIYSDLIQDEDYYGLGVCHWKVTGVGPEFAVHGETFTSSDTLDVYLHKSPQTEYFKKSEFLNRSLSGDGALVSSADNPKVLQRPGDFFPITVTVKEAKP
jgi:hypothetical protein